MTNLNKNCLQFLNTTPNQIIFDFEQEKQEGSFYSFSKNNFSRSSSPAQSLRKCAQNPILKDFEEFSLNLHHHERDFELITGINDIQKNSCQSPRFDNMTIDNGKRTMRCEYLELLMMAVCELREMRKQCVQIKKNMGTLVLEENSHRVQLTEYFEKLNLLHFNQIQKLKQQNNLLKTENQKLLRQVQLTTSFTLSLQQSCQKNAGKTSLLHKLLVQEINQKGKSLEELIEVKKEILKESDINKKLLEENFYLREKIYHLSNHQSMSSFGKQSRATKLAAHSSSEDLINLGKTWNSISFQRKLQNSSICPQKTQMGGIAKQKVGHENSKANYNIFVQQNRQKSPTSGKEVLFFSRTQNQISQKSILSNLREKVQEMKYQFFCLNSMAKIKN